MTWRKKWSASDDSAMPLKYELPSFLAGKTSQAMYSKWLKGQSKRNFIRDKGHGNAAITNEVYKVEIHRAVIESNGFDQYTGEALDWSLTGKYDNAESKKGGRKYKAARALLPTIDHCGDGLGPANFKICSWRTNDAKHDLSYNDFIVLCRRVLAHADGNLEKKS
jgi:hypothetical protein